MTSATALCSSQQLCTLISQASHAKEMTDRIQIYISDAYISIPSVIRSHKLQL